MFGPGPPPVPAQGALVGRFGSGDENFPAVSPSRLLLHGAAVVAVGGTRGGLALGCTGAEGADMPGIEVTPVSAAGFAQGAFVPWSSSTVGLTEPGEVVSPDLSGLLER